MIIHPLSHRVDPYIPLGLSLSKFNYRIVALLDRSVFRSPLFLSLLIRAMINNCFGALFEWKTEEACCWHCSSRLINTKSNSNAKNIILFPSRHYRNRGNNLASSPSQTGLLQIYKFLFCNYTSCSDFCHIAPEFPPDQD